jgi:phosphohistidine phosphatase
MNVYLVRHAEALPVGGAVTRDADRVLSPGGEEQARVMAKALSHLERSVGAVITSPLTRARMTGEILASAFAVEPPLRASENLSPGFHYKSLLEELLEQGKAGSVVAVGHQPDMANFISWLVADASPVSLSMPPGAMALLVVDPLSPQDQALLRWLLTPAVAAALSQPST